MKITFLGATQEVTGSRYLLEHDGKKILVDCGLFQGGKELKKKNWDPFPINPSKIDAVILTHAHIDHTGYIPVLVKNGFKGKIYCSHATYELCKIMLVDSAKLQEEDAKKYQGESLYTEIDVERSFKHFNPVDYDNALKIAGFEVTFINSGHILGASFLVVSDGKQTVTFTGDLGRPNQIIMKAPPYITHTDYLVLDSTYGNRLHEEGDTIKLLGDMVNEAIQRKGVVIIPAFAVGRTQAILYSLYALKANKIIPDVPIYLDSPMAISVTKLFCQFNDEHKLPENTCTNVFDTVIYTRSVRDSKKIDHLRRAAIIIAGSGMADGGRVSEHFKHYISDAKNMVIFVGFQAHGTQGRALIEGVEELEIDDKQYPVRAAIKKINSLSAHADYQETLDWLSHIQKAPKKVFLTHGEMEAAQALKEKIKKQFGWKAIIPAYLESFDLD